jgi:3-isopropylmalate/(R)-2-methylmalate dehydratase small subunit
MRYILIAAAMLWAGTVQAAQIKILSIDSSWDVKSIVDLRGGNGNLTGNGTNEIRWGQSFPGHQGRSGFRFNETAEGTSHDANTLFNVGVFTHMNRVIYQDQYMERAQLNMQVRASFDGVERTFVTSYMFSLWETPNFANPCANGEKNNLNSHGKPTGGGSFLNQSGCADRVQLLKNDSLTDQFTHNGLTYSFELFGFDSGAGVLDDRGPRQRHLAQGALQRDGSAAADARAASRRGVAPHGRARRPRPPQAAARAGLTPRPVWRPRGKAAKNRADPNQTTRRLRMDKFTQLTGIAAPLPLINVDTDMIIPKQFLKTIKRSGLGANLFDEMRFDTDGNEIPDFVLNRPAYREAQILVAGENFGCGSSREHAPWALLDFGIRCVIAPSYADIFFNNCFKNGILPIVLPQEQVDVLMKDAEKGANARMTIDLEAQTVTASDGTVFPSRWTRSGSTAS